MGVYDTKSKNSRVVVDVANLQCPSNLPSLPYKDTKVEGWTLALQTYSVLEICQVCHTKIRADVGVAKLAVSLKFANSTIQRCKNSRVDTLALQTYRVSLRFAKSTIQRYKHSRVDVGVANLLCVLEICKA